MPQRFKPSSRLLNTEQAATDLGSSSVHRAEDLPIIISESKLVPKFGRLSPAAELVAEVPLIILASAFDIPLPDKSIQMVVTSPPYFNQRNYADGTENDFGREKTVQAYVQHTVACLREIRRVLKDDGVVWWNIGDSYDPDGSLWLVPQSVAIEAKKDGWIVRAIPIWYKPNCMPESVRNRPTRSHEQILMLVKQRKYCWNEAEAREPAVSTPGKMSPPIGNVKHQALGKATLKGNRTLLKETRNMRDVWIIPTQPHKEAHVAQFPEKLVERCIRIGSSEGDTVLDPFAGSGTTGLVARSLNRKSILLDISPEYMELMRERLNVKPILIEEPVGILSTDTASEGNGPLPIEFSVFPAGDQHF